MKKPKSRKPSAIAKNQVELAKALGVSRQSINTWAKLPGAPTPKSDGRHVVALWKKFMAGQGLKQSDDAGTEVQELKMRMLRTKTIRAENQTQHEISCRQRLFVPVAEMQETYSKFFYAAKTRLLSLPHRLCQKLAAHREPESIANELRTAVLEVLSEMEAGPLSSILCEKCSATIHEKNQKKKS